MNNGGMVKALKLGDTGWALLGAQLHVAPAPDAPGFLVVGVAMIGARDNALVNNEPRAAMVHELFRCRVEDAAGVFAQVESASRPALDG
jgi:hypothetical protein